jgi:hypothetical protein
MCCPASERAVDRVCLAHHAGFVYHHAGPEGAVLTLWLPEDEPNALPAYPTIGHGVRPLHSDRFSATPSCRGYGRSDGHAVALAAYHPLCSMPLYVG